MSRVRVIGVGSPFGHDQLGWLAIEILKKKLLPSAIECLAVDRPGVSLLELIKDIDIAVLIDAIDDDSHQGEIRQLTRDELLQSPRPVSSHDFGISETLNLGDKLGLLPDTITLFGVCIDKNAVDAIDTDKLHTLCETVCHYVASPGNVHKVAR